jgi:hypothetical protein
MKYITFLLAAVHLVSCRPNDQQPPTLFTLKIGEKALSLRGTWKFQPGDDPSRSRPDFPDEDWRTHPVPGFWKDNGANGLGMAWYRAWIDLPGRLDSSRAYVIALSQVFGAAEIYWDGRLLLRQGKIGASKAAEEIRIL